MTKTQLKKLIKQCLNEVVDPKYTEYSSIPDLTIVSTVTGSDVDHIKTYILELHRVLKLNFEDDVQFEEKLKKSILSNKDIQIEITFTIIDIIDDLMLKTVRESLQRIHEQLTTWALNKKLKIKFIFNIE